MNGNSTTSSRWRFATVIRMIAGRKKPRGGQGARPNRNRALGRWTRTPDWAAKGVLLSALALILAATFATTGARAGTKMTIGGGSVTGVYQVFAERTCALINTAMKGRYGCNSRSTLGSVVNIKSVTRRVLDFGIAQSDQHHFAWSGQGSWEGKKPDNLRSVFSIHYEYLYLLARADRGIKSLADLPGRVVNIGNPGSGQRQMAEDVLRLHGLDWKRDIRAEGMPQAAASKALIDGRIDAFFYSVGLGAAAIRQPAERIHTVLIPIDGEAIRKFVAERPYYFLAAIPAGSYRGVNTDVMTYAVAATLVSAAEVPEATVYDLVKTVFENLEDYRAAHPAFSLLTPETMLTGLAAPLHPGAVRYYKERGWIN